MKIVLTGKMSQTRDDMYRRFSNYGITVMKQVSGTTDYLVTGDRPGGNKKHLAKLKEIPILTEQEFLDLMITEYPEYML